MLVDLGVAAAVVGESKKITERHVRHETCEGDFLQEALGHVIRQRYVLHTQVTAVFQIVAGVLLVETYPGNVGLLSGYSPSFEYAGVLITTDRKSTRLNSSHANISYAVFCLKKK